MREQPFHLPDLPIMNHKVYHLNLSPGELAPDILIVGDPNRVSFIAENFLRGVDINKEHRGLRTITGYTDWGQRVSITTSGMGTPSLEIVLNEVVALHEIDFYEGKRKEEFPTINIIRVGTSGGLQPDTELGTLVITEYSVGLDNTGLFYDAPIPDENCQKLEKVVKDVIEGAIPESSRFKGKIEPYASKAHPAVVKALIESAQENTANFKSGITVSNSGFFANQGRSVSRIPLTVPDIDVHLSRAESGLKDLRFENMEMEASFLLHFMFPLGHRAGAICPIIDKRPEEKFLINYQEKIIEAAKVALQALRRLREWT
ncbi:uridine phosphorylase [Hydrogenivirga caldilitoris]|uniref:Uridine phosphorylase n=1 Tax=Hydrogenivirga caldilitoris TaxID=246264 RepID=A0A497XPJ4_9AQUI|nr:nucleoside phosphorylase [Hydrogenivirga caldilitoris]RLJ70201.1 uridine phosphorylase [Hydrogenivirga caldilitoris]